MRQSNPRETETQIPEFDEWIEVATRGLCEEAAERVSVLVRCWTTPGLASACDKSTGPDTALRPRGLAASQCQQKSAATGRASRSNSA